MKAIASLELSALDHQRFETPLAVGIVADPISARRLAAILQEQSIGMRANWRSVEEFGRVAGDAPDAVIVVGEAVRSGEQAALRELRRRLPEAAILVVLADLRIRGIRKALEAGVDGVVEEAEAERCLPSAVRAACAGQLVLPRTYRDASSRPALSPREKQVLGLVVMGFGNAAIAARLHVAESTVKSHLTAAFMKLGVRSRSEASALILHPVHGLGLGVLAISPAGEGGE